jgi:hypothetical protein
VSGQWPLRVQRLTVHLTESHTRLFLPRLCWLNGSQLASTFDVFISYARPTQANVGDESLEFCEKCVAQLNGIFIRLSSAVASHLALSRFSELPLAACLTSAFYTLGSLKKTLDKEHIASFLDKASIAGYVVCTCLFLLPCLRHAPGLQQRTFFQALRLWLLYTF